MIIRVKNGTVVTAANQLKNDVWIKNERIVAIGEFSEKPGKTIDAEGMLVLPGGIDPHVHMHLPTPAGFSSDDFATGGLAALYGGTTTIIDFVTPNRGQSLIEALEHRIKEAGNSACDYAFHVSPVEWRDTTRDEIIECIKRGVTSFKIYMAYKNAVGLEDDEIENVLQTVGEYGGLVTVHAEMGDEIDVLRDTFAKNGQTEPKYHPLSRPNRTEADAVQKVIDMAKKANCPIYIVHVSTKEALKHIEEAQQKGQTVYAETCPHYLLLDDSVYNGSFDETCKYVLSPPIRTKNDSEALWEAIKKGTVSTIGTDHCPFNLEQKKAGEYDFRLIPNGAGGVEHRLSLLYTHGVLKNKITPEQFVALMATQPAKIFGLYPQKGTIEVGSDADIVIWNPNAKYKINSATDHQNVNLNIFEDFETIGRPLYTILKGTVIIKDNEVEQNPHGEYLR